MNTHEQPAARSARSTSRRVLLAALSLVFPAQCAYAEIPDSERTIATLRDYFEVKVANNSKRRERIERYFNVDTARPIKILVFDHAELKWDAYSWSGSSQRLEGAKDQLSRTPDGNARLIRERQDQFLLFVVNTNPFLYSREGSALAPIESSGVADLKALASAIASFIAGAGAGRATVASADKQLLQEAQEAQSIIAALPEWQQKMALFVQKVEFGKSAGDPGFTPGKIKDAAAKVMNALDELAMQHTRLVNEVKGCAAQWAALGSLLRRNTILDDDLKAARADLYKAGDTSPASCLDSTPRDLVERLISAESPAERERRKTAIAKQPDVEKAMVLLRTEDVLSQRKNAEAALAQLTTFVRIADCVALGVTDPNEWDPPLLNAGAAILNLSFESQRWDRDYPGMLTIKNDSSLCADCSRIRPVVEKAGFLLTSRRDSFLGVGFGVTFTSIKDPTFGKVSVDPTGKVPGYVIGRTAEESRSGLLAILGIFRPLPFFWKERKRGWLEPGIEFGAGIDPKKPAGFLGLSFEFWKAARLGVGGTWQSVTELDQGLTEATFGPDGRPLPGTGSPVVVDGDVRTRKHVTGRLYYSLVLSLDALPFFEPKKN